MLLKIKDHPYAFNAIKSCIDCCKNRIVDITPEVISASNQRTTIVFDGISDGLPVGTFRVSRNGYETLFLKNSGDFGPVVRPLPADAEWEYYTVIGYRNEIYEKTGVMISRNLEELLLRTQPGKQVDIMFCGHLIITAGNVAITIVPGIEGDSTSKKVTDIPDNIFNKLENQAIPATQIIREKIAEKIQFEPVVTKHKKIKIPTSSKLINGIPDSLMKKMRDHAKSEGISVNQLILERLTDDWDMGPYSRPAPDAPRHTKLIPGIPKAHAKALKAHAAAEGISVNKLILGLLEEI